MQRVIIIRANSRSIVTAAVRDQIMQKYTLSWIIIMGRADIFYLSSALSLLYNILTLTQCISGQSANRKRQLTVHPKIITVT